ncbi:MAG: phage baseplate assembly protein V [Candidatus Thorarchaeota archaeon]
MTTEDFESLVIELSQILRTRFFGKYRGTVDEIGTGDKLGYIRAIVPEVYGETNPSPWAKPVVPMAGSGYGWLVLPKRGDGVWMEFETGDISRPIWTGFWWDDKDELPNPSGVDTRVAITPRGHKFILDDEKDEIRLVHSNSSEFKISGTEIQLSHSGGSEIKMTSTEILLKIGACQISITPAAVNINMGSMVVN